MVNRVIFQVAILIGCCQASTPYISGMVTSNESFLYGKFSARMQVPSQKGSTSGFFTMWNGPDYDYVKWNSIEMEVVPSLGSTPLSIDLSYGDGNDRVQYQNYDPNTQPGDEYHLYEFTWTPNEVAFFFDGYHLESYYKGHPGVDNQTKHQNIELNLWAPRSDAHTEDWSAGRDDTTMPWYLKCDYVEYSSWDSSSDTFSFEWREDFNKLDTGKWKVANDEGFDQNLSTYKNSQVFVEDGKLVLKNEPYQPWAVFLN